MKVYRDEIEFDPIKCSIEQIEEIAEKIGVKLGGTDISPFDINKEVVAIRGSIEQIEELKRHFIAAK